MVVGVPKEIKNNENRVSLTPAGVGVLMKAGHTVLAEMGAGEGSGISDDEYSGAGAILLPNAEEVYARSDIIVKVKEPLPGEYGLFREGQTLFTYLHLASDAGLTHALLEKKVTAIAYETVRLADGSLPLLSPMSEIAGRMAVLVGADCLQTFRGGSGVLLSGVPGVAPGETVILGGGTVGTNAAKIAYGIGSHVTVLDKKKERLTYLDDLFGGKITTLLSTSAEIAAAVAKADLLIGAVLVPGAKAPKLVSESEVRSMKKGSVIVDVAIDQGGSIETVDHATTHDHPCYIKYGVVHYSVANMPGAVARTSTFALDGATLPYLQALADNGVEKALLADRALLGGLNTCRGKLTCKPVADSLHIPFADPMELLGQPG